MYPAIRIVIKEFGILYRMFCSPAFLSKNGRIKLHRKIKLSGVLCGYEIMSRTLREERRLRVFENRC